MNSPWEMQSTSTAAGAPVGQRAGAAVTTGGTAVVVAAVPPMPQRRSHEALKHLDLIPSDKGEGGGALAPPVVRAIRWLA